MKKQSYSFPSVYEAIGTDLHFVSKNLIDGLQLYDADEQPYIIGNLALAEGISPNKLVNSSPYEVDYQLLMKAGILLANHANNRPVAITTGFPFSTFQVYKDIAREQILNLNKISYNPGTYSNKEKTSISANIQQVEILPEMIGNIIALRVGEMQAEGNFFVVSLGFGTCEAVLSTENGIVHRTALSINGMQYAVDLFMRSLATKYYLGLKTEKQLDVSFRNDYIVLDRHKVNIVDLRKRILQRYYKDIISTGLRRSFNDADFERADKIYLTGGGALFPELIEQFEEEFNQIAKVEVVKNPLTLTSEGYSLNSIMLTGGDKSAAIGLDVGNANTVLTQYEDADKFEETTEVEKIVVKKEEEPVEVKEEEKVEAKKEEKTEIKKEEIKTEVKKEIDDYPVIDENKSTIEIEVVEKIEKKVPEVEKKKEEVAEEKKEEKQKLIKETIVEGEIDEENEDIDLDEKLAKELEEEIAKEIAKEMEMEMQKKQEKEIEEETEEDSYQQKLAELSEEEKQILTKEISGKKEELTAEKDDELQIKEEKIKVEKKGSLENYEPDFS